MIVTDPHLHTFKLNDSAQHAQSRSTEWGGPYMVTSLKYGPFWGPSSKAAYFRVPKKGALLRTPSTMKELCRRGLLLCRWAGLGAKAPGPQDAKHAKETGL